MRYDAELAALRSGVERVVVELVVGPKSSAATRKAILPHIDDLAAFLGRRSAWIVNIDGSGSVVFLMRPVISVFAQRHGKGCVGGGCVDPPCCLLLCYDTTEEGRTGTGQQSPAQAQGRSRPCMSIKCDATLKQCMVACRESNDFLLPAMITFLNDREWQLRAAFFRHICEMGSYAGSEGLQAFLLPCLEQVCCSLTSV